MKKKNEAELQTNIQLAGIGVFIIFFLALLLLFRHSKTNPDLLEFLGTVGLLILFEFISMVKSTFISHFELHNPVIKLLVSVCIASILAPFNRRVRDWMKRKLTAKNARAENDETMSKSQPN